MNTAAEPKPALMRRSKAELADEVIALRRRLNDLNALAGEDQGQLLDAIMHVSEGFALFDGEDRLVLYNDVYREMYGFSDADLAPGTPLKQLIELNVRRGMLGKERAAKTMRRRTQIYGKTDETFEVPLAGGRWVQIRDRRTSAGGTVSIHADVTMRKQSEQALQAAKEQAEAAADARSEFVAVVSHEVRTPMNGVLGMARLLRDTTLDPEQRECVETIVASGEALLTILDNLLDISKLDADKLELETAPFIVADVVQQSVAVMAAPAQQKGLMLVSDVDVGLPAVVTGDPHRLRQVLLNLISNAIKFTTHGKVLVTAQVESGDGDNVVLAFAVADSGVGISPEVQAKLFRDYTQGAVDVARKYGGTGLGLAICRRLVDLMGGEIGVDSTPGVGTTFRFTVSLAIDRDTDVAELRRHRASPIPAGDRVTAVRPLRVLQVEDNAANRNVVEKTLARAGHRVFSVGDGAEALTALAAAGAVGGFDIVLMDRHMPEMDGNEATRRIRQLTGPERAVPIIGITAGATKAEMKSCLEAGMNAVLSKPLDGIELLAEMVRLTSSGPESVTAKPEADRPVLMVDDTRSSRVVARNQLAKLGLECDLAASGAEALRMVETRDYAIIFADISMPEMDGLELTQRLRQIERIRARNVPIFAVTGHTNTADHKRFRAAGMVDILVKPATIRQMADVIDRWYPTGADADAGEGDSAD